MFFETNLISGDSEVSLERISFQLNSNGSVFGLKGLMSMSHALSCSTDAYMSNTTAESAKVLVICDNTYNEDLGIALSGGF